MSEKKKYLQKDIERLAHSVRILEEKLEKLECKDENPDPAQIAKLIREKNDANKLKHELIKELEEMENEKKAYPPKIDHRRAELFRKKNASYASVSASYPRSIDN